MYSSSTKVLLQEVCILLVQEFFHKRYVFFYGFLFFDESFELLFDKRCVFFSEFFFMKV